ncbi:MAG: hypothetical protein Q9P90_07420 [candidate division KSB1 bacterium]|nr:hypothetical protein [candidate division KSB1 bacterium]
MMKEAEILSHLETIVTQMGIELRYEKGDFKGGICRVGDKRLFLLNQNLMPSQKINLLTQELSTLDLSGVYVLPAIREMIDRAGQNRESLEAE